MVDIEGGFDLGEYKLNISSGCQCVVLNVTAISFL